MLQFLKIKNLALMDFVELEFENGFNVVTGETGAGKSILLGALGILAGNRIAKTSIKKGEDFCEVEALVSLGNAEKLNRALEKMSLPKCENGELVLRRKIHAAKPGRISINGALATLSQLAEIGEFWIDFHGPGEPQKLFNENYQLEILDLFAGNAGTLAELSEKYFDWKKTLSEIEALKTQEKMSPEEIEFVKNQLEAMRALELSDEAISKLESDFNKISRAKDLDNLIAEIENSLGENGASGTFPSLLKSASEVAEILPEAARLFERANSLAIEIEDLRQEFSSLLSRADFDPEAAEKISEKMNSWLELRRKYGPSAESVRAKKIALEQRLESQSDVSGKLSKAEKIAAEKENELRERAKFLHEKRQKAAKNLAAGTQKILVELGFKKADLEIRLAGTHEISATGTTNCAFLFAPNAGQDLLPLNKIASAGETARVMLALKTVLAEVDETPVLVFDEADANVGGEIAVHVARKLAEVAREHQLFCITHLAQVAALGDHHFCVLKKQSAASTTISISLLDKNSAARENELARMIGDRNSASALAHAKELLSAGTTKSRKK